MGTTCRFEALDSWFFRESRPHNSIGDSELGSVFPPSPRTLAGALRTLLGESVGVDWSAFARGDGRRHSLGRDLDLREQIGFGDNSGRLRLDGPWLARLAENGEAQTLFPAPRLLVEGRGPRNDREVRRLRIGPPVTCDLGRVRLPEAPGLGDRSLEDTWLTSEGLAATLAGAAPGPSQLVRSEDLFFEEPRLGIARANSRRTTIDGLLYQNRHIRPASDLALEVGVSGIDPRLLELAAAGRSPSGSCASPPQLARFGGEGRLSAISMLDRSPPVPDAPQPTPAADGLILCLLTAADLGFEEGLDPLSYPSLPGFQHGDSGSTRVWKGEIAGIRLTLHSAAIGRAAREGGWDLARRRPRPVRSLVPAGSCWYCTAPEARLTEAIAKLHGAKIGNDRGLGRGRLAVGLWNSSEITLTEDRSR